MESLGSVAGRAVDVAPVENRRSRAILKRPRLVRAIGDPMALTVIRGPLGAGKTVLLKDWAESPSTEGLMVVRVPEAQYARDEDAFWRAVLLELRLSLAPAEVGAADPDVVGGSPLDLVCELLASDGREVVVVLDHPDRIVAEGMEGRIAGLLQRFHHVRIIASLRTNKLFADPARWGVDYRVIGPDDLRFTPAEAGALWAQAGTELPAHVLDALFASLCGLPVLIRAAVPILWRFEDFDTDPKAAWAALRGALGEWIDGTLPDLRHSRAAAQIAIIAAVHGIVTVEIVDSVIGAAALDEPGEGLEALGILYETIPGVDGGWSLVPAIRELVLQRVRDGAVPEANVLIGRLAEHLARVGESAGALRCGLLTGDWAPLWPVLRDSWAKLVVTDIQLVRDVLAQLPAELAAQDAGVNAGRTLFAGLDAGTVDVVAGMSHDNAEFLTPDGIQMPFVDVVSAGTVRSVIFRVAGDFESSSAIAARIGELNESVSEAERREVVDYLPLMRLQWAINHQLADEFALADGDLRSAYAGGVAGGIDFVVKNAVGSLAMNEALRGETGRAEEWLAVEGRYGDAPGWLGPLVRVSGLVARALVALERMELAAADGYLAELGEPDDVEELWAAMVLAHGRAAHMSGRPEIGLDRVHRALASYSHRAPDGSFASRAMKVTASQLYSALGQGNDALAVLAGARQDHPTVRVCRARVLLLSGDPAAGLAEAVGVGRGDQSWQEAVIESLLLAAAGHHLVGEPAAAAADLRRAVAMAEMAKSLRPLLTLPRALRQMLAAAGVADEGLREFWGRYDVQLYPDEIRLVSLTPQEDKVLQQLAEGTSLRAIADLLFVSPNTIKTQLQSIYRKLEVGGRDEAVQAARQLSLL